MDFVKLIPELLREIAATTGVLYTDQQVGGRKGQPDYHALNGNLFLFKKGDVFMGSVSLRDGTKIQVSLAREFQKGLSEMPAGLSIDQLCISGAISVARSGDGYHFSVNAGGGEVLPRFMLKTEIAQSINTAISAYGTSVTNRSKVRKYQHMLNGRLAYEYECPADKVMTLSGNVFNKKQITDWLEASLEDYWSGIRVPGKADVWATPPAYWGNGESKTDMRYILAMQYHTAAAKMAQDAGCKLIIPAPTPDFEGFWERFEVMPVTTSIPTAPIVAVPPPPPIITVKQAPIPMPTIVYIIPK